jgi:arabinose-5-phosphate isomerase
MNGKLTVNTSKASRRECAIRVIEREAAAIAALAEKIDERFDQAVELIRQCRGRVIVTGMGKSGLIGKKIAATFSSTGIASFFLHPAEGGHGDLGIVTADDVVLAISKSGDSDELVGLLPPLKRLGVPIIVITARVDSPLAQQADCVVAAAVDGEAGADNLIPTSSTTAALVIGDALAVTLLEERGFSVEEFARLHPKGQLGRRLLLTVGDIMHVGEEVPIVTQDAPMKQVILEVTAKRFGSTAVVDDEGKLVGIFTDGDLRRWVEKKTDPFTGTAAQAMTRDPKTINAGELAVTVLNRMQEYKITCLLIVDDRQRPVGIVHLHDLLAAGVV